MTIDCLLDTLPVGEYEIIKKTEKGFWAKPKGSKIKIFFEYSKTLTPEIFGEE